MTVQYLTLNGRATIWLAMCEISYTGWAECAQCSECAWIVPGTITE